MTVARARPTVPIVCASLALLAAISTTRAAVPAKSAAKPAPIRLVEVLHRSARLNSGKVDRDAVLALADAAVVRLLGEELPLDAWASLFERGRPVVVVTSPDAGPLADAVISRLLLVAPKPDAVVIARAGDERPPRGARVVVWRPSLTGDAALPALPVPQGGDSSRTIVLTDLIEPTVEGSRWAADAVLASRDVRVASFGALYVLRSRAARAIVDATALAKTQGVDLARLEWLRASLP